MFYSRVKLVSGHPLMAGFENPTKLQSLNQIKWLDKEKLK